MLGWILPLIAAGAAGAAVPLDDPCAVEGACRHIDEYRIEDPQGEVYTFQADADLPWVTEGNILITLGESVTVALVDDEGTLLPVLMRAGEASRGTAPGIGEIRFSMADSARGSVMLTVDSAYPESLDYAALMVSVTSGPDRTSVCSLMPGLTVFEQWNDPIYQLALWGFRPTEEPGCNIVDPEVGIGDAVSS